jgi:hypothetical protein
MVWRLFATKLETVETMEGIALNMRTVFLPNLNFNGRTVANQTIEYD